MADDIVTRLQKVPTSTADNCEELSLITEEAADEIARLRAAGDALARVVAIDMAVQLFGASSTHTQVAADAVKAWHEASRG